MLACKVSSLLAAVQERRMQSVLVKLLMPEGSPGAALLVRRSDGQFAIERIDARVASAAHAAAKWSREVAFGETVRIAPTRLEMTG